MNFLSWGAVSHGAVLRGLERAKIDKRIARFHYGIMCGLPFDPELDHPSEIIISRLTGHRSTRNTVLWFVKAVSTCRPLS
jgi:hypothetical protein